MTEIRPEIRIIKKGKLCHIVGKDNRLLRFKPWLGDSFAFLYDFIMSRSIFPKKFGGDIEKHYQTLSEEFAAMRGKRVLELGTGSGSAVHFLGSDNDYTGSDVSPGLLKQAAQRFAAAGFANPEFYVAGADDLPFAGAVFDICLCILSMNFVGNIEKVFQEISRVLLPGGRFVCSVPVPERNKLQSTIRGVLYSEAEYDTLCRKHGFKFESIPCENGALLYFRAIKQA